MRVALFIPCYVDALFPEVGVATLELLERFGCEVAFPLDQTCCGQPMGNTGCERDAAAAEALFVRNFAGFDYVVAPSGSCVHHVRNKFTAVEQTEAVIRLRASTYELVEFLHDILQVTTFPWAAFPYTVSVHNGCSTLRALNTASMSEIAGAPFSKPMKLLEQVAGISFAMPARPDECCGFGGTFCVSEEPVSARMGYEKVRDHQQAGAHYVVSADPSCLMHQQACAKRLKLDLKFIHIAELLNGAQA